MRKCIIGAVSARTTDVVTGLTTTVLGWNNGAADVPEHSGYVTMRIQPRNGCRNESRTAAGVSHDSPNVHI